MKKLNRINLLIVLLLIIASPGMYAQKADSLSALRDFLKISGGYKQVPMYLAMEMKNSTNFMDAEDDTATVQAEFFLGKENSYVHFGELEQIVNDSLALLVSDDMQQMILYLNAGTIVQQMKNMMGMALPDSSVRKMALKYSSSTSKISEKKTAIQLQSRNSLYGTSLPKEMIELQYNSINKLPEQVTTMKRSLLPLDSVQYSHLKEETVLAEKLLTLEGSYYLIKEQFTYYKYQVIEQGSGRKVPVQIADRIYKNEEGEYVPVKKYEAYRLTKNE